MDTETNLDASRGAEEGLEKLDSDESCILIEKEVTTIEIEDSFFGEPLEVGSSSSSNSAVMVTSSVESEHDDSRGQEQANGADESQPADDSQCEQDVTMNGNDSSVLAPNADDLDCTPIPAAEKSKLLIDIKFANKKTYLAFQEEFVSLVKNYYKAKLDDLSISDDMANNRIRVSEKLVKRCDEFLVDKTPNSKDLKASDDESAPTYRKSFGKILLSDEKVVEETAKRSHTSSRNVCFNCDGHHSLRDCPEPRNMKKINKARNEYNKKDQRYHEDAENKEGMVPGKISDDLRAALGITATQIPMHVYRMRVLGYPPAWIEEAKVHNSGLSLFVDKNTRQLQPGIDDGEMEDNDFKFDVQKIYDFPGFNVEPDHKYMDQYRMYGVPPLLPEHSKEALIQSLGVDVVNGYKKKKMRHSDIVVDSAGNVEYTDKTIMSVTDMEIEDPDSVEILPLGVTVCHLPPLPSQPIERPPETLEDGELSNESSPKSPEVAVNKPEVAVNKPEVTVNKPEVAENKPEVEEKLPEVPPKSPEIESLRQARQALLSEIAESSVFLDTESVNTSLNVTAANSSLASLNHSQLNETIIENSENENRDNSVKENAPQELRTGHVDTTVLGCPVLPSFTPYNTLPDGDKFQEGVCDVIAFENLAESTGKYEKMKELIAKVRVFQKNHQKE